MTRAEPSTTTPAAATTTTAATATGDGRNRRRDLNRLAVVEALLALYDSGRLEPSIAEIATAAGLSARSVFRYFDDVDDLARSAIEHQQQRLAPLMPIAVEQSGPFEARVDSFVAHRLRLLDAMGSVGRVARLRADAQPLVAAELARVRAELRRQVAEVFATELAELPPPDAADRLAIADVACSYESYHLMRTDQGLSPSSCARAMRAMLQALFRAST